MLTRDEFIEQGNKHMDGAFDNMQRCKHDKYPGVTWSTHFKRMIDELKEAVDCYEEALKIYKEDRRARST